MSQSTETKERGWIKGARETQTYSWTCSIHVHVQVSLETSLFWYPLIPSSPRPPPRRFFVTLFFL